MTKLSAQLQAKVDAAKEIEVASMLLAEDLKYPVDAQGRVLDMNHLPDVLVALVFHLIRCGWRRDETVRMIKQRPVQGAGYYEDLVTYVGMDEPDTPIIIQPQPQPAEQWSVKPVVNVSYQERPDN